MKFALLTTLATIAFAIGAVLAYASPRAPSRVHRLTVSTTRAIHPNRTRIATTSATAKCPKGYTVAGGGFTTNTAAVNVTRLLRDNISFGGWTVKIRTWSGDGTETPLLRVIAYCVKYT